MTIAVLGLNHKSSRLELREVIQRNIEDLPRTYASLPSAAACDELVLLSTCNRIEIYFISSQVPSTVQAIENFLLEGHAPLVREFRNSFYLFQDEDAIRHCFTVAPGLDSMILGEPEILGQMKQAFQTATLHGTLKGPLLKLFEKAFQAAKEVRSETDIGKGAIGTASVSMALAEKACGSLTNKSILIVGAGKFSEKLIMHLVRNGCLNITVSSRRPERGQALAQQYAIKSIPFSDWPGLLDQTDLFISATTHPTMLLSYEELGRVMLRRDSKPLCLIDLAVPRTIDPDVSSIDQIHAFNIEDLKGIGYQNLKFRENAMAQAYAIIHARNKTFLMGLKAPDMSLLAPKLTQLVRDCIYQEIWPVLEPYLLSEDERKTMEGTISQWERNLSHRLLTQFKTVMSDDATPKTGTMFAKFFQEEFAQLGVPDVLKQYPEPLLEDIRKRFHEKLPSLTLP